MESPKTNYNMWIFAILGVIGVVGLTFSGSGWSGMATTQGKKIWEESPARWGPPYCHQPAKLHGPPACEYPARQVLTGLDCSNYENGQEVKTAFEIGFNFKCVSQGVNKLCSNGKTDVGETDVDCGGNCASKCEPGAACRLPSDCKSAFCNGGRCAGTDGIRTNLKDCIVNCWDVDGCMCPAGCLVSGAVISGQTCGGN